MMTGDPEPRRGLQERREGFVGAYRLSTVVGQKHRTFPRHLGPFRDNAVGSAHISFIARSSASFLPSEARNILEVLADRSECRSINVRLSSLLFFFFFFSDVLSMSLVRDPSRGIS